MAENDSGWIEGTYFSGGLADPVAVAKQVADQLTRDDNPDLFGCERCGSVWDNDEIPEWHNPDFTLNDGPKRPEGQCEWRDRYGIRCVFRKGHTVDHAPEHIDGSETP